MALYMIATSIRCWSCHSERLCPTISVTSIPPGCILGALSPPTIATVVPPGLAHPAAVLCPSAASHDLLGNTHPVPPFRTGGPGGICLSATAEIPPTPLYERGEWNPGRYGVLPLKPPGFGQQLAFDALVGVKIQYGMDKSFCTG